MSHEIRTPINAILGLLELVIKKYKTNEFDIQSIDIAYQAANDLLDLIGDILDISKIESGKLTLMPEKTILKIQYTLFIKYTPIWRFRKV
ncbi:sensor histidine kinase [Vibrio metschnikovii]